MSGGGGRHEGQWESGESREGKESSRQRDLREGGLMEYKKKVKRFDPTHPRNPRLCQASRLAPQVTWGWGL